MCGRYVSPDEAAIERAVQVQRRSWASRLDTGGLIGPSYNVAPTDPVPVVRVVRARAGEREGLHMRWGFVPWWAQGRPLDRAPAINARAETLRTNGMFRDAWRQGQRCLVALSGYFEWQAQPPDWRHTVPYYITVADQPTFFLAGVWDRSRADDGVALESVAVVTVPANPLMQAIHNSKGGRGGRTLLPEQERRMPAILAAEDHEIWLSGTSEQAYALLRPYPADLMVAWPVGNRVNSVRNNGPDLIEPVALSSPDSET